MLGSINDLEDVYRIGTDYYNVWVGLVLICTIYSHKLRLQALVGTFLMSNTDRHSASLGDYSITCINVGINSLHCTLYRCVRVRCGLLFIPLYSSYNIAS